MAPSIILNMDNKWKDAAHKEDFKAKSGISVSTARTQLIKALLFDAICKLNKNTCHRCGDSMLLTNYSIEHIKPWAWESNAYELFTDLTNVTFSHLNCNVTNSRRNTGKPSLRRAFDDNKVCCNSCSEWKLRSEFNKNRSKASGTQGYCKPCRSKKRSVKITTV